LKILITSQSFSPQVGGVSQVVYQHAKHFVSEGHDVTVVTEFEELRDFDIIDGIKVKEFKVKGGPLISNFYRGEILNYFRFLKKAYEEYDIIFFHAWQIWATDLVFFLKLNNQAGAKLMLVSHCAPSTLWNSIFQIGRSILLSPYIYFFMPILMKKFDKMIFLSDKKNGDRHRDHKFAAKKFNKKICTIPNGIPDVPEKISPSAKIHDLYLSIKNKKILLFVANFVEGKNQKLAIEIYENLSAQSESHLLLIGNSRNTYYKKLISIVKEKNLEKEISVLHDINRRDIFWLYSKSYLTLFTSKTECSPLAVLESLAFGKPVVATDVGCLSEWEGVSVCYSPKEITGEVDALLKNHNYYTKQQMLISQNKDLNSWKEVMKKYSQLLIN
tara:strand:+ start:2610 stop:3767 length:1158 start_codon:yes stop_codon:yes gene_type:complete